MLLRRNCEAINVDKTHLELVLVQIMSVFQPDSFVLYFLMRKILPTVSNVLCTHLFSKKLGCCVKWIS